MTATFVLVHGAWHGAWCWQRLEALLAAAGHRVVAPDLPGAGERDAFDPARIGLGDHVAAVVALLERADLRGVVLCGHSYGGAVISGVADRVPERIAALVYLDAFVPADGEALVDLVRPEQRDRIEALAASGEDVVPPIPAAAFRVNEADRVWVDAMCRPQPLRTFTEKLRLRGASASAAKTYIRAAAYPNVAFERFHDAARRDPGWTTVAVDCGHDVMLDRPAELAAILERCALSASRSEAPASGRS